MAIAEFQEGNIYYEINGEGEPVLLIHGAAASGRWFGDFSDRLAESHRVIMPDLRGLGQSQRIDELDSPRAWVDDMWHIMDIAEAETAHVMGVSLGSRIAARMALENPERVRSLIVDAPIIGISSSGNKSLKNVFGEVDEDSNQAREWLLLHGPDWRDAIAFYAKARATPGLQELLTVRDELASIQCADAHLSRGS